MKSEVLRVRRRAAARVRVRKTRGTHRRAQGPARVCPFRVARYLAHPSRRSEPPSCPGSHAASAGPAARRPPPRTTTVGAGLCSHLFGARPETCPLRRAATLTQGGRALRALSTAGRGGRSARRASRSERGVGVVRLPADEPDASRRLEACCGRRGPAGHRRVPHGAADGRDAAGLPPPAPGPAAILTVIGG